MIRKVFIIIAILAVGFVCGRAYAAEPLNVQLSGCESFRHLLETDDWLFVCRSYLAPITEHGFTDTFSVVVTSEDFEDVIVLENKVHIVNGQTGAKTGQNREDFTVVETGGSTDITAFCTLAGDNQTIACVGTGLGDATYTVQVTYRSGWSAYQPADATLYLQDLSTVLRQAPMMSVGYQIGVLYLTPGQVLTSGLSWEDADARIRLAASPILWDVPDEVTQSTITWQTTATAAATKIVLAERLSVMLKRIEQDAVLAAGTLVNATNNKITNEGKERVQTAWPFFTVVAPLAFEQSTIATGSEQDRGAGDTTFFESTQTTAQTKGLYEAIEDLAGDFGTSTYVIGFFVSLGLSIAAIVMLTMIMTRIGTTTTAVAGINIMVVFAIFWVGVIGGYVHWVVPGIATGLIGAAGVARIAGGMIMGRG